ncbi:hypothetical protein ACFLIM_41535 [Nonomuraea sp. M3C6]|uniref:Uncharacterized protein n=1 Tax=Nonomuraea marmarensis TaxID=3351344 RepID=A0ABW7AQJ5_9ACTN
MGGKRPETYLAQVCQWDSKLGGKKYCGKWNYAFRFQAGHAVPALSIRSPFSASKPRTPAPPC